MNQDAKTRSQRAVRQLLESWQRSGVTYLRQIEPLPELPAETTSPVEAPQEKPVQTVAPTTPLPRQSIVPPPQPTETSEEPTLESEQDKIKKKQYDRTKKKKKNKI